jgi:hypothetical protein
MRPATRRMQPLPDGRGSVPVGAATVRERWILVFALDLTLDGAAHCADRRLTASRCRWWRCGPRINELQKM